MIKFVIKKKNRKFHIQFQDMFQELYVFDSGCFCTGKFMMGDKFKLYYGTQIKISLSVLDTTNNSQ